MTKLKKAFYFIIPFLGALLFAFIESFSFSFVGYQQSYLSCLLGFIFYFSVFNPSVLNIFFVFILGIISDYLIQAPVGMQAFLFTLIFFLAYFNRRLILMSSFLGQWLAFILVCGIIFISGLILLKIAYGSVSDVQVLLKEYISTILFYPFIAWICGFINVKLGQMK